MENNDLNMTIQNIGGKKNYSSNNINNYNCLSSRNKRYNDNKYLLGEMITSSIDQNDKSLFTYSEKIKDETDKKQINKNNTIQEDPLDISQKKFLENYKSFLSTLDYN